MVEVCLLSVAACNIAMGMGLMTDYTGKVLFRLVRYTEAAG